MWRSPPSLIWCRPPASLPRCSPMSPPAPGPTTRTRWRTASSSSITASFCSKARTMSSWWTRAWGRARTPTGGTARATSTRSCARTWSPTWVSTTPTWAPAIRSTMSSTRTCMATMWAGTCATPGGCRRPTSGGPATLCPAPTTTGSPPPRAASATPTLTGR